jgi:hypothetical protein
VKLQKAIVNYWLEYYVNEGLCSLCGNRGVVDTQKTAKSDAGILSGRLNYCLCPNGQIARNAKMDLAELAKK